MQINHVVTLCKIVSNNFTHQCVSILVQFVDMKEHIVTYIDSIKKDNSKCLDTIKYIILYINLSQKG